MSVTISLLGGAAQQFFTNNGTPLSGGKVYTYAAGTTTPKATFTSYTGGTAHSNPIILDSAGRVPGGQIWVTDTDAYKFVIYTSTDVLIASYDNIVNQTTAASVVFTGFNGSVGTVNNLATSGGSDLIGFLAASANAAARSAQAKMRDFVSLKDFGAVGDGATDDTVAINRFLAATGNNLAGYIPSGTYRFTAPLNAVVANNITIYGPGYLLYTGVAAPASDLLTFGDGVSLYQYLDLSFGGIGSSTALTANFAVRVKKFVGVNIDTIINGPVGNQGNLYQGIWFDNTSTINLGTSQFYTTAKNILWNNGSELHCAAAQVYGKFVAGNGTGIGIHIAGGCGGFYSENINQLYNEYGVIIDTSVSATGNTQMFFDTGAFDTNKIAAVFVNDSVSNSLSKTIHLGCWVSSSTAGGGLVVGNWRDGKVYITTAKIINHTGAGVYLNDATTRVEVSNASRISNNNVGIDAGLAVTVLGNPAPFSNTAGNFGALVSVKNNLNGLQEITQDLTKNWLISSIPNSVIIASGANVKLADGTGLLMVTNTFNGDNGLYLVGGSAASFVASNAGTFVASTTTPAAGKVSVAWNGSTGYNIYSNFGSSQTYIVSMLLKTRDAV